ncbi:hypothetical protein FRB95_013357 [Tulasnella sp. JGI-2019a]|nr:hypothetical protein FRB95_013357 [Tulasnella sp. JGI-2019a]
MSGRLQHKVAVITGAGSGIGLETSLLFAQEGADLVLADINLPAVESVSALIKERYPNAKARPIKCDVSKEAEIKMLVDTAVKDFGRLDIMVKTSKA